MIDVLVGEEVEVVLRELHFVGYLWSKICIVLNVY